jgi:diguanylate cyclase (GGDEF)-like protein
VIFITGLSDVDNEEKGFLLGACDYIQKPFHATIVRARVKLHLQLAHQCKLLEELASIDPLTSLANRRKFDHVLEMEWLASQREQTQLTILMLDIDFFKPYNDHYGHPAGDVVIKKVAKVLSRQFSRPRDFVARYGGEEFVVILPNTCGEDILAKMDECCRAVEALSITHDYSQASDHITVSIGGVGCTPTSDIDAASVVEAADAHLYLAKGSGRNQAKWLVLEVRD